MALTPEQKKRLAALDSGPEDLHEEPERPSGVMSARMKALGLRAWASSLHVTAVKVLIVVALIAVAVYFITINDLHKINIRGIFAKGSGSPLGRISDAVKLQREKNSLLDKGRGHLRMGEYDESFKTALQIRKLDGEDPQWRTLISDTVDALTQKATRELESGEIRTALEDVRLSLKYAPNRKAAIALYTDIADRLLFEAKTHHERKEYSELIVKAQEVLRIDPTNMAAAILLGRANEELLAEAAELFTSKRYTESFQKVQLSLKIDPNPITNPSAHRLFDKISHYVESPRLELRGIVKIRGKLLARIQLPGGGQPRPVREGEIVKNFKVLDIDPEQKSVLLEQIYTRERITIQQKTVE